MEGNFNVDSAITQTSYRNPSWRKRRTEFHLESSLEVGSWRGRRESKARTIQMKMETEIEGLEGHRLSTVGTGEMQSAPLSMLSDHPLCASHTVGGSWGGEGMVKIRES